VSQQLTIIVIKIIENKVLVLVLMP